MVRYYDMLVSVQIPPPPPPWDFSLLFWLCLSNQALLQSSLKLRIPIVFSKRLNVEKKKKIVTKTLSCQGYLAMKFEINRPFDFVPNMGNTSLCVAKLKLY